MIDVTDALMAEYGLNLTEAWLFPLEAYLALVPALIRRHGGKATGPTYVDRASMAARDRVARFLERHFRILPEGEPGPPNALARGWEHRQSRCSD